MHFDSRTRYLQLAFCLDGEYRGLLFVEIKKEIPISQARLSSMNAHAAIHMRVLQSLPWPFENACRSCWTVREIASLITFAPEDYSDGTSSSRIEFSRGMLQPASHDVY